jgi:hypothetical protein
LSFVRTSHGFSFDDLFSIGFPCSGAGGSLGGQDNGNNQSVETESLAENENKDNTNIDIFLSVGTDTSVTSNTEGKASSEG